MLWRCGAWLPPAVLSLSLAASAADYLDLAPFGRTITAIEAGSRTTTVEWDDERDVREIRVRNESAPPGHARIAYWFRNWPYPPPRMPTMEDPVDDQWQGKWLVARSTEECRATECVYRFEPLSETENPLAKNLPGTRYRRALKVRVISNADAPPVSSLQVFSETTQTPVTVRVELGRGEKDQAEWNGSIDVFN